MITIKMIILQPKIKGNKNRYLDIRKTSFTTLTRFYFEAYPEAISNLV